MHLQQMIYSSLNIYTKVYIGYSCSARDRISSYKTV